MNMKIDQRLISWPRYSKYEIITAPNGSRYIRPTEESYPVPFHYVKEKERMVIDAINVGMLVLGKKSDAVIDKAVLEFVTKHGLLGLARSVGLMVKFPVKVIGGKLFVKGALLFIGVVFSRGTEKGTPVLFPLIHFSFRGFPLILNVEIIILSAESELSHTIGKKGGINDLA